MFSSFEKIVNLLGKSGKNRHFILITVLYLNTELTLFVDCKKVNMAVTTKSFDIHVLNTGSGLFVEAHDAHLFFFACTTSGL